MKMRKVIFAIVMVWPGLAAAENVVIAALGDSLTQGYGLPQEQGFVPQLQTWLSAKGAKVQMINAGVSGDTTAGGAARAAWTLTSEVDAMIVALGANDVLRGVAPSVSRANMRSILQTAAEAEVDVLLVGMEAPGNYGPAYKAEFDAIYPELAEEFQVLHANSFFDGLAVEGDLSAAQVFMQSDGIHPNADGVGRIVENLGPAVLDLIEQTKR